MSTLANKVIAARKPKPQHPVSREIAERFSPRCFADASIPLADMQKILEAARLAPSARNNQPWYYFWTSNKSDMFDKLLATLPPNNAWAKTAAVFVVAYYIERNEKGYNKFALYDLGASVMSLVLQAQHLGYYARQMGIFNKNKVKKIIPMDENAKPFVIIALGKLGNYENATEDIVQKDLTSSLRKTDIAKQI
jgi:nitroreductase